MDSDHSSEYRRFHRITVSLEIRIRGTDRHGAAFEETTSSSDVSRGGCSLQTSRELTPGTELELEIQRRMAGPQGRSPFLTRGVVMRFFQEASGMHTAGLRFIGPQFPTYSSEST